MTISFWQDVQESKSTEEFDVLIVGAGIAGSDAAYWLGKRHDLSVAVIDGGLVGEGASGRSNGFVMRGVMAYYNKLVKACGRQLAQWVLHFNEETQNHLTDFAELYGNTFAYDRSGSYLLAASIDELQDLAESAQLMAEDGFKSEYLRSDPVDRGFYGALYNSGDIGVNPVALIKALLAASKATVYENEQVYKVDWANNQALLHTQKRLLSAPRVLLCTNAFLPLMFSDFAATLKVVRGQILVTRPFGEKIVDKLCYANYGYDYFRQLPDGRLLLGGCREPFNEEETGFADAVTRHVQGALQHYLRDKFPEVAGSTIDYRWSGTMCFTPDGLPIIGEHHDKPGVVYLAGCNGHGLGYSLALSKLLVDFALDGAKLGPFDGRRLMSANHLTR